MRVASEGMVIRRTNESGKDDGARSSDSEAGPVREEETGISLVGNGKEANQGFPGEQTITASPQNASTVKMQLFCLHCQGFWTSS